MRKIDRKKVDTIIVEAKKHIGAPYERGAHLPSSSKKTYFDCSSFVQFLFRKVGVTIPRSSILQAADPFGKTILPKKKTLYKKGDLIFMRSSRGFHFDDLFGGDQISIGHVCLYIGNGNVIHASKRDRGVAIDSLKKISKNPIYKPVLIKRYFDTQKPFSVPLPSQKIKKEYSIENLSDLIPLYMILSYHKISPSLKEIKKKKELSIKSKKDISLAQIFTSIGKMYGLRGDTYDWTYDIDEYALYKMGGLLRKGPLILSMNTSFTPSLEDHYIVITGIDRKNVYYNSQKGMRKSTSMSKFLKGWKKKGIFLHS